MIVHGTFVRSTESPTPLEGAGSVRVMDDGIELTGPVQRTTFVTMASIAISIGMAFVVVLLGFVVRDALGGAAEWRSLRTVAGAGGVALVVTYAAARRWLPRISPPRDAQIVVPHRYVVSGAADAHALHLALSAPDCSGRVTFQTKDGEALLAELRRRSNHPRESGRSDRGRE
jgi:hypothetical protein